MASATNWRRGNQGGVSTSPFRMTGLQAVGSLGVCQPIRRQARHPSQCLSVHPCGTYDSPLVTVGAWLPSVLTATAVTCAVWSFGVEDRPENTLAWNRQNMAGCPACRRIGLMRRAKPTACSLSAEREMC